MALVRAAFIILAAPLDPRAPQAPAEVGWAAGNRLPAVVQGLAPASPGRLPVDELVSSARLNREVSRRKYPGPPHQKQRTWDLTGEECLYGHEHGKSFRR